MREAVIVSAARTPIGKAYRGAYNKTAAPTLASYSIKAAIDRAGIDPKEVEDVGFLTLSLLTYLQADIGYMPEGLQMAINYGADKVRFMEAVPVNSKIRGRFVLAEVNYKKNGRWLTKTTCTIEIEGKEKPAAVVEALTLYVVSE